MFSQLLGAPADPGHGRHARQVHALTGVFQVRPHATEVLLGRPGPAAPYTSVEIYDPTSDTWSAGTSMQEGRSGFGAAVIGGRIYVAGGEVLELPFSVRDTVESYDAVTDAWRFEAPLPVPLHGIGTISYEGRFLIFGGASMAASAAPRTGIVHIYGP